MEFKNLKGMILTKISGEKDDEEIFFETNNGRKFKLWHDQNCCESVTVEDICGDLNNLIDIPILLAEEITHEDENPDGVKIPENQNCFTWTFYKLSTIKGSVTIRWYGSSNGYYSEEVSFNEILPNGEILEE